MGAGPPGFDASVSEICMALLRGACLMIAPRRRLLPGKPLAELVSETAVTHLTLPPSALAAMPVTALASVETLVVAGAARPPALVAQWFAGRRMINAYGPTETTVCATMSEPLSGAVVPRLGTTLGGSAVYVLDASLRECGPDVPGELCVAGPSLALGYLGRPDLTAQRFVANPFGPPGSRMYRTGDLAVRRADGSLHFLGRIDDQVKIRGFLVEPHEVEQVMLNHPAVAQAAVGAAARPRRGPPADRLRVADHPFRRRCRVAAPLRRHAPAVLVPAHIAVLDALPVTHHGKVGRAALPAFVPGAGRRASRAARTREEAQLAALYAGVLGLERVSPHDSFFDLGGHSLSAIQLVSKIGEAFHVDVELDEVYEFLTVEALAKWIAARRSRPAPSADPCHAGHQRACRPQLLLLAGSGADRVFCVHAVDGSVSPYRELARQLATHVTVCGFTAIDLECRALPPPSLKAIAASYIDQMRQLQPDGPYHLAGWSSGGLLAYEMACQLDMQGQHVGSVTALDAWRPQRQRPWRRYDTVRAGQWTAGERNAQWRFFLTKYLSQFHTLEIADPQHAFWPAFDAMDHRDKHDAVMTLAHDAVPAAPCLTTEELAYVFEVILLLDCAVASFEPAPYEGSVDVYVTDFESRGPDTLAYWRSMPVDAVNSRLVPGNHAAVVELPGVAQVATTILAHMCPPAAAR